MNARKSFRQIPGAPLSRVPNDYVLLTLYHNYAVEKTAFNRLK
jgi:hypothetical protein